MKKSTVLIMALILCVVAWVGASYFIGGNVKNRYFNLLEEHGHWGPVALSSQNYQRGIFGSKAETALKIEFPKKDQEASPESLQLVFEHTFRHGPLPFGIDSGEQISLTPALALIKTRLVTLSKNGEEPEKFLERFPELAAAYDITKVALNGATSSRLRIPAFEKREDDMTISWGGLTADSNFDPSMKTLVGTVEMPGIEFSSADAKMSWSGISGQFDLLEALPQIYVGSSKLETGDFELNLSDPQTGDRNDLVMKGFEISYDSNYDGKLLHFKQIMELAGVTVNGKTFGPGICDIEMKNLDGEVLSDFQSQIQELYRGMDNFNSEELTVQLIPLYSQFFLKLIQENPELNINRLYLATPMGEVDGNGRVKFTGQPGLTMDNPATLLQHLEANVDIAIHESLVNAIMIGNIKGKLMEARDLGAIPAYSDEEVAKLAEQQLANQIEAILAQKFIIRESEKLKASATFKGGELLLNGQSLPIFQTR